MATEYKVVLVGNSATGKTTMSNVLVGGNPKQFSPSTIGVEYRKYTPSKWFQTRKTLGIWDTAGQPRYASIVQMYFRNCSCILYCIPSDATPDQYQDEMDRTMRKIQDEAKPGTFVYIVVTKCDLLQMPWHLDWVDTWSWKWSPLVKNIFYTSSYENADGIMELFDTVADSIDANCPPHPTRIPKTDGLYYDSDSGDVVNWQSSSTNKKCSGGCVIS